MTCSVSRRGVGCNTREPRRELRHFLTNKKPNDMKIGKKSKIYLLLTEKLYICTQIKLDCPKISNICVMVYVAKNERKANGKVLLRLLKGIDGNSDFVSFMNREKELELAITDAMKTPRVKSGNSLREIISDNGI
jgi:hypothetical protein